MLVPVKTPCADHPENLLILPGAVPRPTLGSDDPGFSAVPRSRLYRNVPASEPDGYFPSRPGPAGSWPAAGRLPSGEYGYGAVARRFATPGLAPLAGPTSAGALAAALPSPSANPFRDARQGTSGES